MPLNACSRLRIPRLFLERDGHCFIHKSVDMHLHCNLMRIQDRTKDPLKINKSNLPFGIWVSSLTLQLFVPLMQCGETGFWIFFCIFHVRFHDNLMDFCWSLFLVWHFYS